MNDSASARARRRKLGFNLVEVTLSLGILSIGCVTLAPLMAVGLSASRSVQAEQPIAQIAQTLAENARQGTLPGGTTYFDLEGKACGTESAIFSAESTFSPVAENPLLSRLKITVTPMKATSGARTYVVVLAPSS